MLCLLLEFTVVIRAETESGRQSSERLYLLLPRDALRSKQPTSFLYTIYRLRRVHSDIWMRLDSTLCMILVRQSSNFPEDLAEATLKTSF